MSCQPILLLAVAAGLCSPAWALSLLTELHGSGLQPSKAEVKLAAQQLAAAPGDRGTALASCWKMMVRANQDSSKDWMLPFVTVPLSAMQAHPEDEEVQLACAGAVSGMSLYNKGNMEAAGKAGAVEQLVAIERQWFEDPHAQIGGQMGCFMDFSHTNRARWAAAGGIDLNMASIKHYFNNSEVVVQGWYAFSSGTQPPNADHFVEAGGVELAVRTMRAHPKGYRVREETMQAMRQVGLRPDLAPLAMEKGWLEEVVTALREAPQDLHQQSAGCANLAIFASRSPEFRAHAVGAGAVGAAAEGLRAFPKMRTIANWPKAYEAQYTVREDCMEALAALAEDPDGKQQLVAEDLGSTATEMLTNLLNFRLQTAGRKVLAALKA